MYFDSRTLTDLLSDEARLAGAAAAIAADRKRLTSPLAVIETVLALSGASTSAGGAEDVETRLLAFLEENEIEVREMPPASKLVQLALAAAAEAGDTKLKAALHKAFADYYEVQTFAIPAAEADA